MPIVPEGEVFATCGRDSLRVSCMLRIGGVMPFFAVDWPGKSDVKGAAPLNEAGGGCRAPFVVHYPRSLRAAYSRMVSQNALPRGEGATSRRRMA